MPARPRRRRHAALGTIVAATLLLGVVQAPVAEARPSPRARLVRLVNLSRARHGLPAVRIDRSLSGDAGEHTRAMLRENRIYDPPNLASILSGYPWSRVGAAAVGCGATVRGLHRDLMDSGVHRAILLHPDVRRIGVGVVRPDGPNLCGRGSVWATEILYG
jgi:uncharacterized protein YkwD